ncbi:MAG: hypothetical protein N2663_07810 [Chlorobi bacterium]|nr:hypothetical protein [Chlorobiota bacterium]
MSVQVLSDRHCGDGKNSRLHVAPAFNSTEPFYMQQHRRHNPQRGGDLWCDIALPNAMFPVIGNITAHIGVEGPR